MAEFEDEEFLSQLAAAEAEALSTSAAKRRRISAAVTTPNNVTSVEGGAYLAVLKGDKSVLFQQKRSTNAPINNNYRSDGSNNWSSSGTADSCFKCGKSGHWARDCDVNPPSDDSVSFPEKKCACGLGNCLVFTANTEKNRGRKFYRCPIRQENGGCGFFEWCDQPSVTDNLTTRGPSYSVSSSFPELPCPCGSGTCLVLTAKTGKNIGQQFYKCPSNQVVMSIGKVKQLKSSMQIRVRKLDSQFRAENSGEVAGSSNGVMTTRPMLASQIHVTALKHIQKWMGRPTKSIIQSLLPVSNVAMLGTGRKIVHNPRLNALLLMEG